MKVPCNKEDLYLHEETYAWQKRPEQKRYVKEQRLYSTIPGIYVCAYVCGFIIFLAKYARYLHFFNIKNLKIEDTLHQK